MAFLVLNTSFINHSVIKRTENLFTIARNRDQNIISYDVNLNTKGKPDEKNPISVYWIKYTENGKKEELTSVQRAFSYGLKFLYISEETAVFQFVSYNKRTFYLKKNDQDYHVYTKINGKWVILGDIFVQIDGGSFMVPKIGYVNLNYLEPNSLSSKTLTFKP